MVSMLPHYVCEGGIFFGIGRYSQVGQLYVRLRLGGGCAQPCSHRLPWFIIDYFFGPGCYSQVGRLPVLFRLGGGCAQPCSHRLPVLIIVYRSVVDRRTCWQVSCLGAHIFLLLIMGSFNFEVKWLCGIRSQLLWCVSCR